MSTDTETPAAQYTRLYDQHYHYRRIRPDLDKPLAELLDETATRLHATAHPDWQDTLAPHALTIARHINQE